MDQDHAIQAARGDWLFSRLPEWVVDTLSNEQKEAIHQAASEQKWQTHAVDVRLTMPWFGRRFYLTVVGGQEKRDPDRVARERNRYPLRTLANIFFFLGLATIFYVVALIAMAMHSAIIEF